MAVIQVDSGAEHFIPYAKKKIRELHGYMISSGVSSFSKRIDVDDGTAIYLKSLKVKDDLFIDKVRIVGGDKGYWVEQYPEQDLWSIASAVLPQIGTALPWTGIIQHITYPYLTSDPRVYETKHQLVICRYCRRVAEYTWVETAVYGTNLELGSTAVKVSSTDHSVTVHYGNPALTYTLIGELVPGSGAEDPGVPGRQIPVMIKRSDQIYMISTAEYDGVSDGDGGFSGGANYGRLVSRDDTIGVVRIRPLKEGTVGIVVLRRNVIKMGEYVSNTSTIATLYDYADDGKRTTRVLSHGLTAAAAANPWGVLTDSLGPRPEDATGAAVWDVENFARARSVMDFVTSEIDRKRFGSDMDLNEVRPHALYRFSKVLVFPIKFRATFNLSGTGGVAGGSYIWDSSYRHPEVFNTFPAFALSPGTQVAEDTFFGTYTLQPPYVLSWNAASRTFSLVVDRPVFQSVYFSLGVAGPNLNGMNLRLATGGPTPYFKRAHFGLYFAFGSAAKAEFGSYLGRYTQEINDTQMAVVCVDAASSSTLSYPAYSALYAPLRGAYYRRSPHIQTFGALSVDQPQIDNADADPLTPP